MTENRQNRYSAKELKEFETILNKKLAKAHHELRNILESLGKKKDNSTDAGIKMLEDSAVEALKENLSQLATRQRKFIAELEAALLRIKNDTYGICIVTGQLIDKERLKVVPHTRHSLVAKLSNRH